MKVSYNIWLYFWEENYMNMRKIYRKIAKKQGVSVAEVKKDMQEAIDMSFLSANLYTRSIPCKGEKPTPSEFISYAAKRARSVNYDESD